MLPQRASDSSDAAKTSRIHGVSNQGTDKHDADVDSDWCAVTYPARGKVNRENCTYIGLWALAGLYYYCGEYKLYVRIPSGTSGLFAMVCVGAPLVLVGEKWVRLGKPGTAQLTARCRRHVSRKRSTGSFDLSVGSPTYIDAIGEVGQGRSHARAEKDVLQLIHNKLY